MSNAETLARMVDLAADNRNMAPGDLAWALAEFRRLTGK
jgi:hypothetical protein